MNSIEHDYDEVAIDRGGQSPPFDDTGPMINPMYLDEAGVYGRDALGMWAGRASVDAAFAGHFIERESGRDAGMYVGHPRVIRRPRSAMQMPMAPMSIYGGGSGRFGELRPDSPTASHYETAPHTIYEDDRQPPPPPPPIYAQSLQQQQLSRRSLPRAPMVISV
jgi:hypothetical protein